MGVHLDSHAPEIGNCEVDHGTEVDFVDGRDLPPILRHVEPRFGPLGFEPTPQIGVKISEAPALCGH
jgi:hypothetical protein